MRLDNQDGVSLTTETSDSNQNCSLSQDWLDVADAEERVIRNLPRVVASLPNIRREGEARRKSTRSNKVALLRLASSYTATFLLGGVCVAFGARFFSAESKTPVNEPTDQALADLNVEESDLSLDSLAFERPQEPSRVELPTVRASEPSNESPLRFNDAYDSYADQTSDASNMFAPQNDAPSVDANGLQQVAREEESFPTWADLETNEGALPASNSEFPGDDYSFAANSASATYESAPANEPFQQNYAPTQEAPRQNYYNSNYVQSQNSSLELSAPGITQYASNNVGDNYNKNNVYNGNNAINSNVNERVYATNAGNTNYNNRRELDDLTTSNATNEGFGSYSMNADVASNVPVFEERQTEGYEMPENNFATNADVGGTAPQSVDRNFIPTFNAPSQAPTQASPSSSNATYVAQNRDDASNSTPVVSPARSYRW